MFHLEYRDIMFTWEVFIARSDLLTIRWLTLTVYFYYRLYSFQEHSLKTIWAISFCHFYDVIIKFMVLVDFDKLPVGLAKFWFSAYNLRSSSDPHTWSMPYHNSCCWREASCFLLLLYTCSMSPEANLILQKGAEYPSWEKDNKKKVK